MKKGNFSEKERVKFLIELNERNIKALEKVSSSLNSMNKLHRKGLNMLQEMKDEFTVSLSVFKTTIQDCQKNNRKYLGLIFFSTILLLLSLIAIAVSEKFAVKLLPLLK